MARYTNDVLNVAAQMPNPAVGTNAETRGVWGDDLRTILLALDGEHGLKYAGNPNGAVDSRYIGRKVWDTVGDKLWVCTATGTVDTAVWLDFSDAIATQVEGVLLDNAIAYAIVFGG